MNDKRSGRPDETENAGTDAARPDGRRGLEETPSAVGAPRAADGEPEVDARVQAALGRHLRSMFDGFAGAPVPKHLTDLVEMLADKERTR